MKKNIDLSDDSDFEFNAENLDHASKTFLSYPEGRSSSAILPLLTLAQKQIGGYLTKGALEYVAKMLGSSYITVYEIASFYSMYNLAPVGKYLIQVCRTTPCWLKCSDDILSCLEEILQIKCGETTKDGLFTIMEVECLGACVNAPLVQINDYYYENLTRVKVKEIIDSLKAAVILNKNKY